MNSKMDLPEDASDGSTEGDNEGYGPIVDEGFIERIRVGSVEGNNEGSVIGVTDRVNVEGLELGCGIEGSMVSLSDVTFNDEIGADCADCNVVDSNTPHRHRAINKRMTLVMIPFSCCFIT
jgi:hypothetical protein